MTLNCKKITLTIFLSVMIFLAVNAVFAQAPIGQLGIEYGTAAGLGAQDIRLTVAKIIRVFLGLLGIIALALIIYGGYLWMTSAGEEKKLETARKLLINSVIGLAIILSAFAIVQFIVSRLTAATLGLPGLGPPTGVSQISPLSNALGGGIIREHYPGRDAVGIPRNVKVIITFKEGIDPASLIKNYNNAGTPADVSDDQVKLNSAGTPDPADDYMELNTNALKLYPSDSGAGSALLPQEIRVNFTSDLQTWVFDPIPLLGSSSEDVWYTVELAGGNQGALLLTGQGAFSKAFGNGYTWEFQTSTFVDTTPPKILNVIPRQETDCAPQSGSACARNIIITVNFDEPIDPTTVSGHVPEFGNLVVDSNPGAVGGEVSGSWASINQYRSAEFTPDQRCGANSCGNDIFCLPGPANLLVLVRAAALSAEPPLAALPYPYNGVTDMVGNSLDGNNNGAAQGPDADNFTWQFNTSAFIDTTPPALLEINPKPNSENLDANLPSTIVFSEQMRLSTLSNENIALYGANSETNFSFEPTLVPWYGLWNSNIYWPSGKEIGTANPQTGDISVTRSQLRHGTFVVDTSYYPEIGSGAQDLYQNCFFPPNAGTAAGPGLGCATTANNPYCCVAATGPVSCSVPCVLSESGNPICQE